MGLEADIARIVEQAVRNALADHVCSCAADRPRGAGPRQHPGTAPPQVAYTPREVAASLGVSYERVLQMIAVGALQHRKFGQRYVIPVGAIEEYLATSTDRRPGPDRRASAAP